MIKGVKCALQCMDICSSFMAEPFHAFGRDQEAEIRKILGELDLV